MLAPRDATLCVAPQCWPWEKTIVVYYGHLHVQCYIRRAQPVFVFMAEASSSERIHSRIIKTNRHLRWRLEKSRPNLLYSHSGSDTQDWLLPPTLQCSCTSSKSLPREASWHTEPQVSTMLPWPAALTFRLSEESGCSALLSLLAQLRKADTPGVQSDLTS